MTLSEHRLQALLDRAELTDLATAIGQYLAAGDFAGLADIYTPDAELTMPGAVCAGVAGIIDAARRNHEIFDRTQHFVAVTAIRPEPDAAQVHANVVATLVAADNVPRFAASRYELRAVRTVEGWRVGSHMITPVWALPDS
ncbi:nuclear transport factor 2 family protein [Nocardia vaccinii]|uniref:nuclear transport factor 2 family protein n=1 Tax=Nocardia vaccinii TaxID=1822 RepID=UPI00082AA862|nr:nuclear transport factor 2 family protein [Nocardia vaccinii]